jgi:hypothetical protein
LAEAQKAFIEERTLLQRRWAETEQQGVIALERAREEAERILREAREQATEMTAVPGAGPIEDDTDHVTAVEALARLERVLSETREDAETRASTAEAEQGHDNDTGSSGAWEGDQADSQAQAVEADVSFDGVNEDNLPSAATFDVPVDRPGTT